MLVYVMAAIVRTAMDVDAIRLRRGELSPKVARSLRRALCTLHTLETMAVNIYQYQITTEPCELNRYLIAAMCNEMTHLQDFQVKLYEYGWKPSRTRWMYWIVGLVFGLLSRIRGRRGILRMGVWVETKAVQHYGELLEGIPWDDETRRIVEKNRADEESHVARWRQLLAAEG
ncbi:MAG TPA: demethoxyubiquinone hydroxylase family protein [Patescibacteria group bacterium]|nr:demethoxyubiquinone hydroxylase family protein [Patescibacteria group bacterium]